MHAFNFNADNSLVLQQLELNPEAEWVELEANGTGSGIVQVSYQYNVAAAAEKPAFVLKAALDKQCNENVLKLNILTS